MNSSKYADTQIPTQSENWSICTPIILWVYEKWHNHHDLYYVLYSADLGIGRQVTANVKESLELGTNIVPNVKLGDKGNPWGSQFFLSFE